MFIILGLLKVLPCKTAYVDLGIESLSRESNSFHQVAAQDRDASAS